MNHDAALVPDVDATVKIKSTFLNIGSHNVESAAESQADRSLKVRQFNAIVIEKVIHALGKMEKKYGHRNSSWRRECTYISKS